MEKVLVEGQVEVELVKLFNAYLYDRPKVITSYKKDTHLRVMILLIASATCGIRYSSKLPIEHQNNV